MLTKDEFIDLLRAAIAESGSVNAFARTHRLTQSYVHLILKGVHPPSDAVAAAIGYRRDYCFYPIDQTPNTTEETTEHDANHDTRRD